MKQKPKVVESSSEHEEKRSYTREQREKILARLNDLSTEEVEAGYGDEDIVEIIEEYRDSDDEMTKPIRTQVKRMGKKKDASEAQGKEDEATKLPTPAHQPTEETPTSTSNGRPRGGKSANSNKPLTDEEQLKKKKPIPKSRPEFWEMMIKKEEEYEKKEEKDKKEAKIRAIKDEEDAKRILAERRRKLKGKKKSQLHGFFSSPTPPRKPKKRSKKKRRKGSKVDTSATSAPASLHTPCNTTTLKPTSKLEAVDRVPRCGLAPVQRSKLPTRMLLKKT